MMSAQHRAERRGGGGDKIDDERFARLKELLKDAEACIRLSTWEESYLSDFRDRVLQYGADIKISDAQERIFQRIEGKVYQ